MDKIFEKILLPQEAKKLATINFNSKFNKAIQSAIDDISLGITLSIQRGEFSYKCDLTLYDEVIRKRLCTYLTKHLKEMGYTISYDNYDSHSQNISISWI